MSTSTRPHRALVIARLGRRIISRSRRGRAAGGAQLARAVKDRRRPGRLSAILRLASKGTAARPARGEAVARRSMAEPVFRAPGMSEFAARWMFGDGEVEGIPLDGGEPDHALAEWDTDYAAGLPESGGVGVPVE